MIKIEDILAKLEIHNPEAVGQVRKSYNLAAFVHKEQFRQSGEPYITHPLNVAMNLIDMEVWDADTISAALLHDSLEDCEEITKEDLENFINPTVAELVDGVTKISRLNFSTKKEQNQANTRKIINGLAKDSRIILIKLADRLHNMRTLSFKSPFKQKENAIETMELFAPLAYHIGAYRVKSELEDLSLQYLEPEQYKKLTAVQEKLKEKNLPYLEEMEEKIKDKLSQKDIENDIKIRIKNIYGMFARLKQGHNLENIHDLYSLKIMVNEIDDCYRTLGIIHSIYPPINDKFKDYIYNPKTNMYQSLHTTVFAPNDLLIQNQIRTFDMDKLASFGVSAQWNLKDGKTREETQKNLRKRCQFVKSLIEMDKCFEDNEEFIHEVEKDLLTDYIYAFTPTGEIVELPKGSNPIDFAYYLDEEIGSTMIGAIVNEKDVPIDYTLKNKDRVKIITDEKANQQDWENKAHTTKAKIKIKELTNKS